MTRASRCTGVSRVVPVRALARPGVVGVSHSERWRALRGQGSRQQVQGSEASTVDMVGEREGKRGAGLGMVGGMSCHSMALSCMRSCLHLVSEAWLWSRGSRRVCKLTWA